MKLSERISVDDESEIVTVDGVKITYEYIKLFIEPTAPGYRFRVTKGESKPVIHMESVTDDAWRAP